MAVVYSKVLLFDPPLIYTAPDICVFGAVNMISVGQVRVRFVLGRFLLGMSISCCFSHFCLHCAPSPNADSGGI